ncbi:MAG: T9SS type A sorting domain-containing protein [Chitinophagaceae bacterium]|nr:T9SS type A sorting domain-containing protein [Chitinophagaceae bacterium]
MIKITDVAGKIVLTQSETLNAGSNSVLLKLSHLAAGTYFINTLNEDGTQQTLRFIKQ